MQLKTTHAPGLYERHISVLNFSRFQIPMPYYINVFRDPLERRMSFYYYIPREKQWRLMIVSDLGDQIAHHPILFCIISVDMERTVWNNRESLQKAMNNVQKYYQVSSYIYQQRLWGLHWLHFVDLFMSNIPQVSINTLHNGLMYEGKYLWNIPGRKC